MAEPHRPSFDEATATLARSGRPAPLGVVVRPIGIASKPPLVHLVTGSCVIGSAPSCDLTIDNRTVSRTHVELQLVPEGVSVRDLGSRNGTYYLGQRVESMVLGVGGRIVLGGDVPIAIEPDSRALTQIASFEGNEYQGIVGASPPMRQLFGMLARLEGSLVTVLIEGESGVGKELIAGALHARSRVAEGPFIAVNCGAIARELVASELFGHRRGAFTGAVDSRRGAFDAANGGTLFLDELGELPPEVQPMLLRALETGEVRAVGEDHAHTVKVRLVAATNRDLESRVAKGLFREDLFYRLAVVRLRVPPLRDRPEDIEPLARRFAASEGLTDLPHEVVDALRSRPLPGNVRELRNLVQVYGALGSLPSATRPAGDLRRDVLRQAVDLTKPFAEQRDAITEEFTRLYLEALLVHAGGNQTLAAQIAGMDRTYLGRLLSKLGINKAG
jgi:DNA-binding NtrC family response regulator